MAGGLRIPVGRGARAARTDGQAVPSRRQAEREGTDRSAASRVARGGHVAEIRQRPRGIGCARSREERRFAFEHLKRRGTQGNLCQQRREQHHDAHLAHGQRPMFSFHVWPP